MSVVRRSDKQEYNRQDIASENDDMGGRKGRRREVIPAVSLIVICCATSFFVSAIIPWIIIFSLGWICGHFGMATTLEYSISTLGLLRYYVGRGPAPVKQQQQNEADNIDSNEVSQSAHNDSRSSPQFIDSPRRRYGSNNSDTLNRTPSRSKSRRASSSSSSTLQIQEIDSDDNSEDGRNYSEWQTSRRRRESPLERPLKSLVPDEIKWVYPFLQGGLDMVFQK